MDFKTPIRLSRAAEAAGIPPNTVRSWLQRGQIVLLPSEATLTDVPGSFHTITLRGALRLGIVVKLVGAGLSPSAANLAAMTFMDMSIHSQWEGIGAGSSAGAPGEVFRRPGETFKSGETVLIVLSSDGTSEVVNVASPADQLALGLAVMQKRNPVIVFPLKHFLTELQSKLGCF